VSLLGPFMAVSVFADENPSVAEKFFAGKQNPTTVRSVAQSLQLDLEFMRVRHIN
jgi:ubiquitin conjugation factor E4 B